MFILQMSNYTFAHVGLLLISEPHRTFVNTFRGSLDPFSNYLENILRVFKLFCIGFDIYDNG